MARVERILDATHTLVMTEPIDAITTGAIAERAGLPIGSLYQYFPNRLAILLELARRVIAKIDDATTAALDETHGLPWRDVVDRVVDATFEAHRRQNRSAGVFRVLHPTADFDEISAASNRRLATALARHPALVESGLPRHEIERVARVTIEAGDGIQRYALSLDPAESAAVADEMKKLFKAYLAPYLDNPGHG